jgi:hypothetical protein
MGAAHEGSMSGCCCGQWSGVVGKGRRYFAAGGRRWQGKVPWGWGHAPGKRLSKTWSDDDGGYVGICRAKDGKKT